MGIETKSYLLRVSETLADMRDYPLYQAAVVIEETHARGNTIYCIGNGGSAATASHLAEDLQKGAEIRILAMTDSVPLLTAHGNDNGYESVFAEQLRPFLQKDDLLCIFSGSGNSPNLLAAAELARERNAQVQFFGGRDGGNLKFFANYLFIVPSNSMQIIEDCHLAMAHAIYDILLSRQAAEKILEAAGVSDHATA